ncbi:hypothetical protein CC79DRAFT_1352090 [Sarocladium strictum]
MPPPLHLSDISSWSSLLHAHHRPLLLHLNADTTWLLQLPYPASCKPPSGRTHLNILLDPWLVGPQSDVAWWFSTQTHIIPSSVATLKDLNASLREVESRGLAEDERSDDDDDVSFIDVVAISHEFTDHCHRATLEELPSNTTIFATDVAADLIRTWNHFDRVITAPALSPGVSWTRLPVGDLPPWLAIGRVISPGNALYYHSAVLIAFDINYRISTPSPTAEAVIYSPHGIESQDLTGLKSSGIKALALMHGMHDVQIWKTKQLNLGALNGIKAVNVSGAKYWIATHDEVKQGAGFIAPMLLRKIYTLEDAVATVDKQLRDEGKAPDYEFQELGSGEGMVLE